MDADSFCVFRVVCGYSAVRAERPRRAARQGAYSLPVVVAEREACRASEKMIEHMTPTPPNQAAGANARARSAIAGKSRVVLHRGPGEAQLRR